MQNILLIDDSEEVRLAVGCSISPLEIKLDLAVDMKDGMSKALEKVYDLVIIDIKLPDGDGFMLYQNMRNLPGYEKIPMIFLTSNEDVTSKVSAFSLGADDYIVKPFHLLELRARIESRLRNHRQRIMDGDQVTAGNLLLEVSSQRLKIRDQAGYVSLTPREFKILLLFVKNPDHIFSRERILNKIWGQDVYVTDRTVDAHICYLRKKLDKYATYIESVPGEGYRFNPNPMPHAAHPVKHQAAAV